MLRVLVLNLGILFFQLFTVNSAFAQDESEIDSNVWFPTQVQYNQVYQSGNGNFYFWFKNTGKDTLRLRHVSSTGGNTCPNYSREPVLPGEWSVIHIKYDTHRIGRISTQHNAYFQNIEKPFSLHLKGIVYSGEIKTSDLINPRVRMYFAIPTVDTVKQGEPLSYEIEVFNPDLTDHHLTGLEAIHQYYSIEDLVVVDKFPIVVPKESSARIHVKVKTEGSSWNYLNLLSFRTDENCTEPFISTYLSGVATSDKYAEITFESTLYEQTYNYGDRSDTSYTFTNTGNQPLIISNVRYSGGAMIRSYPREPIMPGESGIIRVGYDTRRAGSFNRTFTISSNARNKAVVLHLRGKVLPKD